MSGGRWRFDPVEGRVIDTNHEPAGEWVSARDALEHLRCSGLPPEDNRKRLAQWAAAGLLPSRALFLRNRNERFPEGSPVPTWVWEGVVEGLWVRELDWHAGSLKLLRHNLGPILDVEAHGIEFDRRALLKMAPEAARRDATAPHGIERPIGRPTSTGPFSATDEVVVSRMQELIDEGCPSPTAAARKLWVAKELDGLSEESASRRVVRKYQKRA